MKIVIIDDAGNREIIRCRKIEPATLSRDRQIIVDEDRVIDLADVLCIID